MLKKESVARTGEASGQTEPPARDDARELDSVLGLDFGEPACDTLVRQATQRTGA